MTIPLSMIGVLFFMQAMGYSINLLTLLAMVLAIGLVVDDAIVWWKHPPPHRGGQAALRGRPGGAREIAVPVVSMTSPSPRSTRRSALTAASPAPCSRNSPSPWPAR
ncbi:efflux RND transporter permease subunit [Pseudomonas aeruginosa]|nr:efflux RND transporter permease subunit [Pseudomonas aeruginosa]